MNTFSHLKISLSNYKILRLLLILCWSAGLLSGASSAFLCKDTLSLFLRQVIFYGDYSFAGLLFIRLVPILITIIVFFYSRPFLLIPLAFLKAFLFSFAMASVTFAFGLSAWLIITLLLLCESLTLPVLWFTWLSVLSGSVSYIHHEFAFSCVIVVLAFLFDYLNIAPFLSRLMLF